MDIEFSEVGKIATPLNISEYPTANLPTVMLLLKEILYSYVRFCSGDLESSCSENKSLKFLELFEVKR